MSADELKSQYEELRDQLDRAYRAPDWDSERIDAIANALSPLERQMAAIGVSAPSAAAPGRT